MSRPFPLDAAPVAYLWTQCLVEELVRVGVDTFFVAPGSRSTPLTVAAARHPDARVVLHFDERGTSFAALGYGRATGRPAGWITTSGTAVANAMPAVAEASTDGVPMLLLTADRPPELRTTGANQTIDQVKIFGDFVRWQTDVPVPTDEVDPAYVLTTADQAVHHAMRAPKGPVHLNCMFRKPLEPDPDAPRPDVPDAVRTWAEGSRPFSQTPTPVPSPQTPTLDALAADLDGVADGLVVAGRLDTAAEAEAVRGLAAHLGWPLLPDVTSRLRLGSVAGARVPYVDQILTSETFRAAHPPEAVVHVGGRYVSKRLRLFLREAAPRVHAVARPDPRRIDPEHRATHHIETSVSAFCAGLTERLPAHEPGAWTSDWTRANAGAAEAIGTFARDAETLSEPLVAHLLPRLLPPEHALVTASSMPVRDVNRYGDPGGEPVPVIANRGASGIDGTVATTAGVAHGRTSPATLLIGDLALWHDLNSLAMLQGLPVVVIVVNNDGGGIFHFLPIRDHEDVFDPFFTTPHGRTFKDAASTFGLAYHAPETPQTFLDAYRTATASGAAALIEVTTDRDANRDLHARLEADVADRLQE